MKFVYSFLLVLLFLSCDAGVTFFGDKDLDENFTGSSTVSGVIVAPDGNTPIPNALVYVPSSPTMNLTSSSIRSLTETIESNMNMADCSTTDTSNFAAFTCTAEDGSFTLSNIDVVQGRVDLNIQKGKWLTEMSIAVTSDFAVMGNISTNTLNLGTTLKIAVVRGSFDHMESVLMKLFGVPSTTAVSDITQFDFYEDNALNPSNSRSTLDLFVDSDNNGQADIFNYDLVILNCGNGQMNRIISDSSKVDILRDFVNSGGNLYATDWAYDFIEQTFPEFIDFYGSDTTAENSPENVGVAHASSIDTNATVLDANMRTWLSSVTCKVCAAPAICDFDFAAFFTSNPNATPEEFSAAMFAACPDLENPDCTSGNACIDANNKIPVQNISGTVVINSSHAGQSSNVKTWVEGVYDGISNSSVLPFTMTFPYGAGNVLYTSFHTTHSGSGPSGYTELVAQERILQYFLFEML